MFENKYAFVPVSVSVCVVLLIISTETLECNRLLQKERESEREKERDRQTDRQTDLIHCEVSEAFKDI